MTPAQYRAAIDRLGLSQVKAAKFLGCDPRTSRHWAAGTAPIPHAVALLLRLMVRLKIDPEDVR